MPARDFINSSAQLQRMFASKGPMFIHAVLGKQQSTATSSTTVIPMATTNVGTANVPLICFSLISDVKGFESFRSKQYGSYKYFGVPKSSSIGKQINHNGNDHVKIGDLEPTSDQVYILLGEDWNKAPEEAKPMTQPPGYDGTRCVIQ